MKICSKCGTKNEDGSSFCYVCGTPLNTTTVAPSAPKGKRGGIIFLIIAAAIIVAALCVLFFSDAFHGGYDTATNRFEDRTVLGAVVFWVAIIVAAFLATTYFKKRGSDPEKVKKAFISSVFTGLFFSVGIAFCASAIWLSDWLRYLRNVPGWYVGGDDIMFSALPPRIRSHTTIGIVFMLLAVAAAVLCIIWIKRSRPAVATAPRHETVHTHVPPVTEPESKIYHAPTPAAPADDTAMHQAGDDDL